MSYFLIWVSPCLLLLIAQADPVQDFSRDLRVFAKEVRALSSLAGTLPESKAMDSRLKKVEAAFDRLKTPAPDDPSLKQAFGALYKGAAEALARAHRLKEHVAVAREAARSGDAQLAAQALANLQQAQRNLKGILEQIEDIVGK